MIGSGCLKPGFLLQGACVRGLLFGEWLFWGEEPEVQRVGKCGGTFMLHGDFMGFLIGTLRRTVSS